MILSNNQQLEDRIVHVLANKSRRTVLQIQEELEKEDGKVVTVQGIYRVLRSLQKSGVIVKEKKLFSLHMSWIIDLIALTESMEHSYFTKSHLRHLLPDSETKKRTWYFRNLQKTADFWGQILLAMAHGTENAVAVNYSPFEWYELVMTEKEKQFIDSYHRSIVGEYVVVGHKSPSDRQKKLKERTRKTEEVYFAKPHERIEKDDGIYIDVIGDYVLKIKLKDDLAKKISTLYEKDGPISTKEAIDLFHTPSRIRVQIVKDEKKARAYYKKFEHLFGPLRPLR